MPALLVLLLAHPHAAPSMWADAEIREGEVRWMVTARLDHLTPWLGDAVAPEDLLDPVPDDTRRKALAAVAAYFTAKNPVKIDGVRVAPEARDMGVPKGEDGVDLFEYETFTLVYPCEGWPRQVSFVWEAFEGANWMGRVAVPGRILVHPQVGILEFSPEEPEYIWHAKFRPPPKAVAPVEAPRTPRWVRTLVWVCVAGLALVLAFELLRGKRRRPVLGVCAAGLVAGIAALVPSWGMPPRPSPEEARAIFRSLHENIYRAFEAATEAEIYDLLAVSVEQGILTNLYLDVYESLILRQQGGAVATIEKVEPVDGSVRDLDGGFEVDWRWRVHLAVTHWGHTHRRVNEYRALFEVRHDGRAWKIAAMKVLDQKRVDSDG